jgi:propionyl-CoA synthetase
VALIREQIGPVASFKFCHVAKRLPKTRSGKYLRHIVKKMYNEEKYVAPSTI